MSSYLKDLEENESLNLSDMPNFKFAVSIENYLAPNQMKISPDFVKWQFRLTTVSHGVHSYKELKHHPCTDKDFDSFYPIESH